MDQRTFLAVGLSMVVIMGFYFFVPQSKPTPPPAKTEASATAGSATSNGAKATGDTANAPLIAATAGVPARVIQVNTPDYTALIDTRGGRLTSLVLKQYMQDKKSVDITDFLPFLTQWLGTHTIDPTAHVQLVKQVPNGQVPLDLVFEGDDALTSAFKGVIYGSEQKDTEIAAGGAPATITLTGTGPNGLTVRKVITFHPDSYVVDYDLQVINYGKAPRPLHVISDFGLGPNTNHARTNRGHYGPMYRASNKIKKADPDDVKQALKVSDPQWIAMTDTYFLTAATPLSPSMTGIYTLVPGAKEGKFDVAGYGIELPDVSLEPQKMVDSKFKLFMGPKSTDEMLKFGGKLDESLDLTLDFIASPLLAMLRWFYSFTGNYGVAIILLTIVVRVALFPFTYKGMVSMKRMSKLQPKMASLRERMKGDKERMNKEMMEMYRKYKVNPLSGCLPILLQIPIFFALYSALLGAIELRHQPFILWITDLSSHDGLYVLPLLMGGSMFFQQKMTPTTMDPTQAKIMMWMPVVFTFFMLNFPAGLTLYWFTSNLLSVLQQLIINRAQVPEFAD